MVPGEENGDIHREPVIGIHYERLHATRPSSFPLSDHRDNGVEKLFIGASEVNPPYDIPCGAILERVTQPVIQFVALERPQD